jgi:hypothetical protein
MTTVHKNRRKSKLKILDFLICGLPVDKIIIITCSEFTTFIYVYTHPPIFLSFNTFLLSSFFRSFFFSLILPPSHTTFFTSVHPQFKGICTDERRGSVDYYSLCKKVRTKYCQCYSDYRRCFDLLTIYRP